MSPHHDAPTTILVAVVAERVIVLNGDAVCSLTVPVMAGDEKTGSMEARQVTRKVESGRTAEQVVAEQIICFLKAVCTRVENAIYNLFGATYTRYIITSYVLHKKIINESLKCKYEKKENECSVLRGLTFIYLTSHHRNTTEMNRNKYDSVKMIKY